jgi:hypothetical protein
VALVLREEGVARGRRETGGESVMERGWSEKKSLCFFSFSLSLSFSPECLARHVKGDRDVGGRGRHLQQADEGLE